ncbi:hypothetical protein [Parafrankia sp. FMc2]|uniref:hypothetical protein n=1 Tax=Parafrankia sp. FMc2 TaxID=3233196 RepID=UPI0034D6B426
MTSPSWEQDPGTVVLTVNAGSHSLKLAVVDEGAGPANLDISEQADIDTAPDSDEAGRALADFLDRARRAPRGLSGHRLPS